MNKVLPLGGKHLRMLKNLWKFRARLTVLSLELVTGESRSIVLVHP